MSANSTANTQVKIMSAFSGSEEQPINARKRKKKQTSQRKYTAFKIENMYLCPAGTQETKFTTFVPDL